MPAKQINNFIKANSGTHKGSPGYDSGAISGSNYGGSNPQK